MVLLITVQKAPTFGRQGVAGCASGHGQDQEKLCDRHAGNAAHTARTALAWMQRLAASRPDAVLAQPHFWDDVNSTSSQADTMLVCESAPNEGTSAWQHPACTQK